MKIECESMTANSLFVGIEVCLLCVFKLRLIYYYYYLLFYALVISGFYYYYSSSVFESSVAICNTSLMLLYYFLHCLRKFCSLFKFNEKSGNYQTFQKICCFFYMNSNWRHATNQKFSNQRLMASYKLLFWISFHFCFWWIDESINNIP